MRALMATVADLTVYVAQTNAQEAQTTLHMHAVSDFRLNHVKEDGAQNSMVSRRVLMAQWM